MRHRALSLSNALVGVVVLAGMWILPILIRNEKWFYLVGLALAAVFCYTVLRGWLELGVVCALAAILVLETILYGYWRIGEAYRIGPSDMILIVLWLAYVARVSLNRGSAGGRLGSADWTVQRHLSLDKGEVLFAFFATCLLGTALSARYWFDMPNLAPSHFVEFGVRGGLMFALTWRLVATLSAGRARMFALALLLFGLVISINENSNILLGRTLLRPRGVPEVWWVRVTEGQEELTSSVLSTRHFIPFGGVAEDAGALMAPLFALSVAMALSAREQRFFRLLYGLGAASFGVNVILYMQRAGWLGALVGAFAAAVLHRRRSRDLLLLAAGVLAVPLTLYWAGVVHVQQGFQDLQWVLTSLVKSDRWVLWLNTVEALPHFPLLFGIGMHNTYEFAYTLAHHSTHFYGRTMGSWYSEFASPHNTYLQILVGAGLPAFAAFMALLGYVAKNAVGALRLKAQAVPRDPLVGVFAALLALVALSFFQRSILHRDYNLFFNFLLGATLGLARNVNVGGQSIKADVS